MEDSLTKAVVGYQQGEVSLHRVRNQILEATFRYLGRLRWGGEDEISEFLLLFHDRIEGLLTRFRFRGLPFRHFLLRTLKWQWRTFQKERNLRRRQDWVVADPWQGGADEDEVAESVVSGREEAELSALTPTARKRLVLLALKAAPYLDEIHLEAVSQHGGVDLAWLQACQYRLRKRTDDRRHRRDQLVKRRAVAFYRRLMAEDEARREFDPDRRRIHEGRAGLYRRRLVNLNRQRDALSTAPTHLEVAELLGMPKGSVDSGLYHLKKNPASVYIGSNEDSARDQQHPQKDGA